jgi:hypothetical protein
MPVKQTTLDVSMIVRSMKPLDPERRTEAEQIILHRQDNDKSHSGKEFNTSYRLMSRFVAQLVRARLSAPFFRFQYRPCLHGIRALYARGRGGTKYREAGKRII